MTRVRGYLHPPETGDYTFWTSSDDHSRLYLSTDADPANKVMIAEVNGYTGALQWDKYPAQKSAPITLQAGQKYYIEVLHRDGTGGDNLAVAWGGPVIGAGPVVIDGQYLSPFIRAVDYLASTPDPANGAVYTDTWATLGWTAGFAAVSHDVYFSNNVDDVTAGATGAFAGNLTMNLFLVGLGMPGDPYPAGLVPGTNYYWRVDEVEADGATKHQGRVWSFFVPPREAYQPKPVDGAKYQDIAPTLSWTAGLKAKLHTVYFGDSFDAVSNATTGGTSLGTIGYTPAGPLENGKTYYWRVDEMDPPATTKGNVWSFTTVPAIAVADPNLIGWWTLDEGEGARAVDWSGHGNHGGLQGDSLWTYGQDGGALRFDGNGDYVDTGNTQDLAKWTIACWVISPAAPASASPSGPLHREKNYQFNWNHTNVVNRGGVSMRIGNTWHAASYSPVEANTWYHLAATFDGTALRAYRNGVLITTNTAATGTPDAETGTLKLGRHATAAQYFNGTVDDARVYNKALSAEELQVVMRGDPIRAGNPSPANGLVSDVARAATLSRLPGSGAAQHAVYFGTDRAAVAGADTSDTTGVYRGLHAAASYTLPEPLAYASGPYYWRVDEQSADGTVIKGSLWSFSVSDYILVDNFESYNDLPAGQVGSNLVYATWKDGFTNPAANGATIGYPTGASMQTARVHSGRQAVPVIYNNTTAPLSEAELPLSPQNWTDHGVLTLSLWFYGDPNNVAGQLYVKVNGVKAAYDGEAVNLTRQQWQPWNVELASVGTNLQSVTGLAIGIEGAGAKGTLLLDDIRLYPLARQLITPVQPDPNGLVGYWRFDEGAGTVATDSSGSGNNGTLQDGPTVVAGQSGQALAFANSRVAIPPSASLTADLFKGSFTLTAWINPSRTGNTWQQIFRAIKVDGTSNDTLFLNNDGRLSWRGRVGGTWTTLCETAAGVVPANQWTHVAVTGDGTNFRVYVIGALSRESAFRTTDGTNANYYLGGNPGATTESYAGMIDDVRIYSRHLSEAEVAGVADRTLPFDKAF